jgi:hypothetical protein
MTPLDWFSRIKVFLFEVASIVSLCLLLAWLLWQEYLP